VQLYYPTLTEVKKEALCNVEEEALSDVEEEALSDVEEEASFDDEEGALVNSVFTLHVSLAYENQYRIMFIVFFRFCFT